MSEWVSESRSLQPHGLYSLWNSPGKNTGLGSLSLLQGIFPTQGLNPGLPHCRRILYQLSHQGSPNWGVGVQESSWFSAAIMRPSCWLPPGWHLLSGSLDFGQQPWFWIECPFLPPHLLGLWEGSRQAMWGKSANGALQCWEQVLFSRWIHKARPRFSLSTYPTALEKSASHFALLALTSLWMLPQRTGARLLLQPKDHPGGGRGISLTTKYPDHSAA